MGRSRLYPAFDLGRLRDVSPQLGVPISLISYIIGYALINLGLATTHSCNQNVIFRLRPDAKSRVNSIYMTLYFIGGACGSALGVYAWHHGGWTSTCLVGITLVMMAGVFALLDTLYSKRHGIA